MNPVLSASRLATVLLVIAFGGGCSAARQFVVVDPGFRETLTITVQDETGWILGAQLAPRDSHIGPEADGLTMSNPDGDASIVRVAWYDNGCVAEVVMTIAPTDVGAAITLETGRPSCSDMRGRRHVLDFHLNRSLPADAVSGAVMPLRRTPQPDGA